MDPELRQFALTVLRDELNIKMADDFEQQTMFGADGVGLSSLIVLELCTRFEEEYDVVIIGTFVDRLPRTFGELFDSVKESRSQ